MDDEQEGLHYSVKRKVRMLSKAPEEYCKTIFEELRELEDQKPREALIPREKKHRLMKCQNERDKARMIQRMKGLRVARQGFDTLSFGSGTSSRKEVDDMASETSWTAVRKSKERERWEPQGEAEKPQAKVYYGRAEGGPADPEGEMDHRPFRAKAARRKCRKSKEAGMEVDGGLPQGENVETQSPKRKVVRVESEETQDCVLESLNLSPEEEEEKTLCHVQV